VFDADDIFPYLFALIAGGIAVTNYMNSRIVEKLGARRVGHAALIGFIVFSILQLALALWWDSLTLFVIILGLNMAMVGFTGANFGSIAMEPFGHVAGAAAAFQSFLRMLVGALGGTYIGQQFDGTTVPLAIGFIVAGVTTLAAIFFAERGKLFAPRRSPGEAPRPAE
jgi:DHA1 family bicyclomycin/chloramphenicol resistance-like MFS transporter